MIRLLISLIIFFVHVEISAQNKFIVKVHNSGGSAKIGNVIVYYASDQGQHKKGDVYKTLGTGKIYIGSTHVLSLPNKNFQVAVGYYGVTDIECKNFIPTSQNGMITISSSGDITSQGGVKEIDHYYSPDGHYGCHFSEK